MNLASAIKAVGLFTGIVSELSEAKSPDSDGGTDITNPERIAIVARVAGAWADGDGQPVEVKRADLIARFESCGWKLTD